MSWRSLFPYESQFLQLNSARMHFVSEGEGDPVLCVHGNPTWAFYWRRFLSRYRSSHQVVALDHIGSGLSDKPEDYDYTLVQHSENLLRLIEELDLHGITLLVHDWGGAIGLRTAAACRERFRRIVLFNTGAFPPPRVPARIAACRLPLVGRLLVRGANAFSRAAMTMATALPNGLEPDVRQGLIAPYDSWKNRRGVWGFINDIPLSARHPTHATLQQLESDLPGLQDIPSLAIWGMRDWCFDEVCLARFESAWPRLQAHRIEDAGHWVVEDVPETIFSLLDPFIGHQEPVTREANVGV